jgi:hypothetical protein
MLNIRLMRCLPRTKLAASAMIITGTVVGFTGAVRAPIENDRPCQQEEAGTERGARLDHTHWAFLKVGSANGSASRPVPTTAPPGSALQPADTIPSANPSIPRPGTWSPAVEGQV